LLTRRILWDLYFRYLKGVIFKILFHEARAMKEKCFYRIADAIHANDKSLICCFRIIRRKNLTMHESSYTTTRSLAESFVRPYEDN